MVEEHVIDDEEDGEPERDFVFEIRAALGETLDPEELRRVELPRLSFF